MTTFSQLVDDIALELLRPDLRSTIASYVNQTIRDVHFRAGVNSPILFKANRFEELLVATNDSPWLWTIPSVTRFQKLETAFNPELGILLEEKSPRVMKGYSVEPYAAYGYYRTGESYAFAGLSNGHTIYVDYFMFPQGCKYLASADRIVIYDFDTDSYERVGGGAPLSDSELAKETNWVLQRWEHVVKEGARAKIWKRLGDDARTRTAYSAFEAARTGLWNTEPAQ